MKKKIIATILATSLMAGSAMTAHAAEAKNILDKYPVTVHNDTTPAVYALGKDWPITRWYFYDAQGNTLGSISNASVIEIARTDGTDNVEWEFWLADAFNDYRGIGESVPLEQGTLKPKGRVRCRRLRGKDARPRQRGANQARAGTGRTGRKHDGAGTGQSRGSLQALQPHPTGRHKGIKNLLLCRDHQSRRTDTGRSGRIVDGVGGASKHYHHRAI